MSVVSVQRPQHRCRIGAAAAQARTAGDALNDADLQALGILLHSVKEYLRRLPGQIRFVGGDAFLVAQQPPGLAGSHIDLDIIPDRNGLHHAF